MCPTPGRAAVREPSGKRGGPSSFADRVRGSMGMSFGVASASYQLNLFTETDHPSSSEWLIAVVVWYGRGNWLAARRRGLGERLRALVRPPPPRGLEPVVLPPGWENVRGW